MPASPAVVVGLDAGTTSAKMVAVDTEGVVRASAGSDLIATQAPSPGASIQRPAEIWDALATACRRGMATLDPTTSVAALAVAAQSGSVIPVEKHGEDGDVATRLITWMDSRSRGLVQAWDRTTQATIRAVSGWSPSPGLGLSTISWLRTQEAHEEVRWAALDDFLVKQLTGTWITNPSNASGMQLMDATSLAWSADLCAIAGVDLSALSALRPSGDRAGHLTTQAAEAMHLPPTTPVVIGGHDQSCAALGLGVTAPGAALLSLGTAWVLTMITDRPDTAILTDGFNLSPHVVPDRWSVSKNLGGFGAALASEIGTPDADLDADLGSPDPALDDPHFVHAVHDADRTTWGELHGGVARRPLERLRALMEACAFEVRLAIEEAPASVSVHELTVVGGGTNSRHLTQRIADTTGLPLTLRPEASWPAVGAAVLAAGDWQWPAIIDGAAPTTTILPSNRYNETIDRRYDEYRRLTSGERR